MGGYGSGRTSGRIKAENCKAIDVRYLQRHGMLRTGRWSSLSWSRDGEPIGSIQVCCEGERVRLIYRYREYAGEWESFDYPVSLTYTSCNYGGRRPWFCCPASNCWRRVAKLYGAGRYFACRRCYRLSYQTQSEDRYDRAWSRLHKIQRRLGGEAGGDYLPPKPKRMHWKTYGRYEDEYERLTSIPDTKLMLLLGRILAEQ
jgi:hypothetical protein